MAELLDHDPGADTNYRFCRVRDTVGFAADALSFKALNNTFEQQSSYEGSKRASEIDAQGY
ncbi:hypothetical protein GCM10010869_25370 [Mesorhizobium tianshanense]|nr:hypothetical protein GCM10010869_25370 [Mesorhizobium tianshanense]